MPVIETGALAGPVTALTFSSQRHLLSGTGSRLSVYDAVGCKLVTSQQVFISSNIHGIISAPLQADVLAVFGGKSYRLVHHCPTTNSLKTLTDEHILDDWIWDLTWLQPPRDHSQEPGSRWAGHPDGCPSLPELLAVALGHNAVSLIDWSRTSVLRTVHCHDKCILYTARLLGNTWRDLVVAAGTVFNQVVLWAVAEGDAQVTAQDQGHATADVMHRLSGHQGVIFSVAFCRQRRQLCSVSDDRSIRLWKVTLAGDDAEGHIPLSSWRSAHFDLVHVLYGHTARVWDALLLRDSIVSVGEDATCIVWDYDGNVQQKFKGHRGKSIWSLSAWEPVCNTEKMGGCILATGGGDTSIRLWEVNRHGSLDHQLDIIKLQDDSEDFPRVVQLLGAHSMIVMTNSGKLHAYDLRHHTWFTWFADVRYSSYSIVCPHPRGDGVAVGNIWGDLRILDAEGRLMTEEHIYDGKVLSIHWLLDGGATCRRLLTTGPEGAMTVWTITTENDNWQLRRLCQLQLPYTKQRWCSAACQLPGGGLVVCGDRGGSLYLYRLDPAGDRQPAEPIQSFPKIHGRTGVTDVCFHDNLLYSAGRDGQYRTYSMGESSLSCLSANRVYKGFDWLTRLLFREGDLLVMGFHDDRFIVYSVGTNQKLFSSHCGGGHRAWDFSLCGDVTTGTANKRSSSGSRGRVAGQLVYIKARDIALCTAELNVNQRVLTPSLHGREINDVVHLYHREKETGVVTVLATAGEDTLINLVAIHTSRVEQTSSIPMMGRQQMDIFSPVQGHLSSVRALAVSQQTGQLDLVNLDQDAARVVQLPVEHAPSSGASVGHSSVVFSGGGRAQLMAWRIWTYDPSQTGRDVRTSPVTADGAASDARFKSDSASTNSTTTTLSKGNTIQSQPRSEDEAKCTARSNIRCWHEFLAGHVISETGSSDGRGRRRKNKRGVEGVAEPDPETRVMALTAVSMATVFAGLPRDVHVVAAACSDGSLRFFCFDEGRRQFDLMADSTWHGHCLLTVKHLIIGPPHRRRLHILSAGTDGRVALWDISSQVTVWCKLVIDSRHKSGNSNSLPHSDVVRPVQDMTADTAQGDQSNVKAMAKHADSEQVGKADDIVKTSRRLETSMALERPLWDLSLHQSGINAMAVQCMQEDEITIVTGGDDNGLRVVGLTLTSDPDDDTSRWLTRQTMQYESAHAAQITGVRLLDNSTIVTSSIDQRVTLWKLDRDQCQVKPILSKFINVADVSAMDVWPSGSGQYDCVISGVGLQALRLDTGE